MCPERETMSEHEYPTTEQMREVYMAYKSGKPGAIAEVLRKRQQEREEVDAARDDCEKE